MTSSELALGALEHAKAGAFSLLVDAGDGNHMSETLSRIFGFTALRLRPGNAPLGERSAVVFMQKPRLDD